MKKVKKNVLEGRLTGYLLKVNREVPKMSTTLEGKISKSYIFKWAVTFIIPVLILLFQFEGTLSSEICIFLAITLFSIMLIAFELCDALVVAIVLFTGYFVSGIAPGEIVFSPWAGTAPWVTLGVLFLAVVLDETGLLRRIAIICVLKTGCTYKKTLWGLWFAGIVLGFMTSSNAHFILPAFCYGICKALNLGKSKESAGIFLAGAVGAISSMDFIYNPVMSSLIVSACQQIDPAINITYTSFLAHNFPLILFSAFSVFLIGIFFKEEKPMDSSRYFKEEYQAMGRMSVQEKKSFILVIGVVGYAILSGITHWQTAYGFMIIPWLAFLPGMGIANGETIKKTNFGMVFFLAGCMAIGSVGGYLNVGELLANAAAPTVSSLPLYGVYLGIWLIAFLSNFLLTPMAVLAALTGPVCAIAASVGIDPLGAGYLMFTNLNQVILPYENVGWLLFYAYGFIRAGDFIKYMSVRMVCHLIFCFVVMIPFWKLIGVL